MRGLIYKRKKVRYTISVKEILCPCIQMRYSMKRRLCSAILILTLLLAGCGGPAAVPKEDGKKELHIVATTYPIYLFTTAVTEGAEGVRVDRLNTGETSCLHDYTLSVNDMKLLERADVIVMNGVGLEDFMEDALTASDAAVIDCSEGVELLENRSHHHDEHDHSHDGHDHGHFDPHIWMSTTNAVIMLGNVANKLAELDPEHAGIYAENREAAAELLDSDRIMNAMATAHTSLSSVCTHEELITFHDGFQYFVRAIDLKLLESIEEEAGSEASAKEILEITALVKEHDIPAIFTEKNGSDATANAIARETGCQVLALDMIMSGEGSGIQPYLDAMIQNIQTVAEAMK